MKPSVSICILSQNHQAFIGDLILSLSQQTYQDFEVLFVDNCSDDKTYENGIAAIDKFELNLFYSSKNTSRRSIPANLNQMMRRVQAENVLIISGDDWLTSDSIAKKLDFFAENAECVAVCSSLYVYNNDTGEKYIQKVSDNDFRNQFEALMLNELSLSAPGAMYKKKALERVEFFDEAIDVEDFDMWLKMSQIGKIGCIQQPLAYYRRHSNNLSASEIGKTRWMLKSILKTMKKYKNSSVYNTSIKKFYNRLFLDRFYNAAPKDVVSKMATLINIFRLGKPGFVATYYFLKERLLKAKS